MTFPTPRPWLASYAEGVPPAIELPTGSLFDLVEASVSEFGDNIALEFFARRRVCGSSECTRATPSR